MQTKLTTPEGVAVLCLLTIGANEEIKHEELTSMLNNPFFIEHVADKIGPHKTFIKDFLAMKAEVGEEELEKRAMAALSQGFPALKLKTLALMTLIGEADGDFDKREKALVVRIAGGLDHTMQEIEAEVEKMKEPPADTE